MAFLDETGLAEVWSLANEKFANISTGTYTGAGTYGQNNANTLTFDFEPKMVIVYESGTTAYGLRHWDGSSGSAGAWASSFIWTYGQTRGRVYVAGTDGDVYFGVSGNTFSWYSKESTNNQLNNAKTYHYLAIG